MHLQKVLVQGSMVVICLLIVGLLLVSPTQKIFAQQFTNVIQPNIVPRTTLVAPIKTDAVTLPNIDYSKPTIVQIPVPFYSQAPTGNWADPFQNACEEASALLLHYYFTNSQPSNTQVEADIINFTTWVQNAGFAESVNMYQLQTIIQLYFGYTSTVLEDPTEADIQQLLDAGYPIIVPLAGKKLLNPYFSYGGPLYHVAVLTGYTNDSYIVQEVGTNFGKDYSYNKQVIADAIHDYAGNPDAIESGAKRILVLEQKY